MFALYNLVNIFFVSHILFLFHWPKGCWNKLAKYEKLRKYWPYCTRNHAITYSYPLHEKCPIRSYYGPYFSAFGLNTERYSVCPGIQSKCGKIRTRITLNTDFFYAVTTPSIETHLAMVRGLPAKKFLLKCVNKKSSSERRYFVR